MAKHSKKRKKTSVRRRRRIGALSMTAASPLVQYGAIAAGYLFGDKINAALDKVIPATVDSKIVGAGLVGVGYWFALRKGAKKSMITSIVGGVAVGAGAKKLMASFGMGNIGGYQMVPAINGYSDVPAVGAGRRRVGIGAYMPGANGLNGYVTAKQTVGAVDTGTGLRNAGSGMLQG